VALILIQLTDLQIQIQLDFQIKFCKKKINKNLKINVHMFNLKNTECQFHLDQKSIRSFSSSDSLESEDSDSSSSSTGNVDIGWAVGADGVVSLLFVSVD
jgi:hypothetical protein